MRSCRDRVDQGFRFDDVFNFLHAPGYARLRAGDARRGLQELLLDAVGVGGAVLGLVQL